MCIRDKLHPAYLASVQEFVSTRDAVQALNTYYWVFATDFLPGVDVVAHNLAECLAAAATETPVNDLSYLHIAGQSYRLLLERLRGSVSGCAITTVSYTHLDVYKRQVQRREQIC